MSGRLTLSKEFKKQVGIGELAYVKLETAQKMESRLTDIEDMLYDADGNEVISLDRLRELCAAERDGRVVVLPCKVDTLRRSIDVNVSEEVCLVEAEGLSRYGNCHLTCFDCYVNALAKAEAEAALSAGNVDESNDR